MTESYFPSIREYKKYYGLTMDRLQNVNRDIVIMHPGPINRGVEITSEVADSNNSIKLTLILSCNLKRTFIEHRCTRFVLCLQKNKKTY